MAFPPTLADFGYGTKTVSGARRLLVLLVEYDEYPLISTAHTPQYYEQLAIGDPTPPFSTDSPVNPASLREYFREVSYGKFWFENAGRIGPLSMGKLGTDPGPRIRCTTILQKVGQIAPQVFLASDADSNHIVAQNELSVLLIENIPNAFPGNSVTNPVQVSITVGSVTVSLTVNLRPAGGGILTPFYQLAHELSHAAVGTVDMYNPPPGLGPNKVNTGMTLMGGYSFTANDQYTVHLDMWHKMVLGWAQPRVFRLHEAQTQEVWEGPDGAILLWDDTRRANQYFLIERRRPDAPGESYDSGFAGDGIVIWRVNQLAVGDVVTLAPPSLTPGNRGAWATGTQTPYLMWNDGSSTGVSINVGTAADGRLQVSWGDQVAQAARSRHLQLFHGGNGSDGVGGLTNQGVFFGVTTNGDLEWNRYNGQGQTLGEIPGQQGWNPNTGDLIGRGFGDVLFVFAAGQGAIMTISPDGDLRWYSYAGLGESDVTGTKGWERNSGNVIGNGWQNSVHVFAFPRSGSATSYCHVFAVDQNGDLRWYGYNGNGEQDPTGHTGWHPNSGNLVGRGWLGFRHIHGSSNVAFAVHDDGTLRWYSYSGHGESTPDGSLNWDPRSGSPIGNGWQGMQHVFGGVTDLGGFGHVVMGVDQDGNLRWYRYTGHGESDITGHTGWDPRSGNTIGTNW